MARFVKDSSGTNALLTDLKAHWKMTETSGDRADSIGSNTLVDNNTVTSRTGRTYNIAAQFTRANNEWLEIADNADLSTGGDFSLHLEFITDSEPAASLLGICGKATSVGTREFEVAYRTSTDHAEFNVEDVDSGGSCEVQSAAVTISEFHSLTLIWDNAAGTASMYYDGTLTSTTDSTVEVGDTTDPFIVGRRMADELLLNMDGGVGAVSKWSRKLTATEAGDMHNSGLGNALVDDGTKSLVCRVSVVALGSKNIGCLVTVLRNDSKALVNRVSVLGLGSKNLVASVVVLRYWRANLKASVTVNYTTTSKSLVCRVTVWTWKRTAASSTTWTEVTTPTYIGSES